MSKTTKYQLTFNDGRMETIEPPLYADIKGSFVTVVDSEGYFWKAYGDVVKVERFTE